MSWFRLRCRIDGLFAMTLLSGGMHDDADLAIAPGEVYPHVGLRRSSFGVPRRTEARSERLEQAPHLVPRRALLARSPEAAHHLGGALGARRSTHAGRR